VRFLPPVRIARPNSVLAPSSRPQPWGSRLRPDRVEDPILDFLPPPNPWALSRTLARFAKASLANKLQRPKGLVLIATPTTFGNVATALAVVSRPGFDLAVAVVEPDPEASSPVGPTEGQTRRVECGGRGVTVADWAAVDVV